MALNFLQVNRKRSCNFEDKIVLKNHKKVVTIFYKFSFFIKNYFKQRAQKTGWKKFDQVMKKVSEREPDVEDRF